MKCLHSYGNKVCGADLFASNNFCHKCGGQCCPKCTRSVTIPNARVCESCGWHLKGIFTLLCMSYLQYFLHFLKYTCMYFYTTTNF